MTKKKSPPGKRFFSTARSAPIFSPDEDDPIKLTFGDHDYMLGDKFPCPIPPGKKILASPEMDEVDKILYAGWCRHQKKTDAGGFDWGYNRLFMGAIWETVRYFGSKETNLYYWMNDKRDARRLCKNARELAKVASQLNAFYDATTIHSNHSSWTGRPVVDPYPASKKVPGFIPKLNNIRTAEKAPGHFQFLAEFLEMIADAPRKKGRREEDAVGNFLCNLDKRFREGLGKPCYRAIALLWQAASSSEKTVQAVKTTIARYRKR